MYLLLPVSRLGLDALRTELFEVGTVVRFFVMGLELDPWRLLTSEILVRDFLLLTGRKLVTADSGRLIGVVRRSRGLAPGIGWCRPVWWSGVPM